MVGRGRVRQTPRPHRQRSGECPPRQAQARVHPHEDTGDFVVVVNADKILLTGAKLDKKFYYHHSGIPGGFKAESYRHLLARSPTFPIEKAVRGMLPKGVLGRQMFTKLKVYATPDHPHAAQKPQPLPSK